MANEQRLATPKQLAYLEKLAAECKATIAKPLGELTTQDASEIIEELLQKVNGGYKKVASTSSRNYNTWSNGARIGLAFKVCYQQWVRSGTNIFKNRDLFVKNVVDTYNLLNEIAEKAEAA